MNLELAHDLLAKQIFQRLSAEEKAMRKAERLLRDGYELDVDLRYMNKRRLLSEEDIAFIKPYLMGLQLIPEHQAYFAESEEVLHAAEEAEKRELKKRLKRNRLLLIGSLIVGICMLVLLAFAIIAYQDLKVQTFENDIQTAQQLTDAEEYEEAVKIYERELERDLSEAQRTRVDKLKQKVFKLNKDSEAYRIAIERAEKSLNEENYNAAIQYYKEAIKTGYIKISEAESQKDIAQRDLQLAFNRYKKRGLALSEVGEVAEACEWLDKAYQLVPEDKQVKQKRKYCPK